MGRWKASVACCIWAAAHHDFGISKQTFFDVNENGTRVLADSMERHGVRDVCFISSVAVYGDAAAPIDERSTPIPNNHYGASKLAAENVLRDWAEIDTTRRVLVIRPTVIFGPNNYANMYSLIRQIDRKRFLQVGPCTNIKSVCFIDNLLAAIDQLWMAERSSSSFRVFNYVDAPDMTSKEIAVAITESLEMGRPMWVPYWVGVMLALPFDVLTAMTGADLGVSTARIRKLAKIQTQFDAQRIREAGFSQPCPLRDGIAEMVEWYVGQRGATPPAHRIPPAVVQRSAVR